MTEKKYTGPAIPTGYEGIVSDIAQKRKVAEALTAAGLQGPGAGARSYAQLLGSLAQTWVGGNLEKKATQAETELNQKRLADRETALGPYRQALASGDLKSLAGMAGNINLGPEGEEITKALMDQAGRQNTYGDPTRLAGPNGQPVTAQFNKAGGNQAVAGGLQLPGEVKLTEGGEAYDPQFTAPGSKFNDPNAMGRWLPNGEMGLNQPIVDANLAKAAAGAAKYQAQFINTGESKYAGKLGEDLGGDDASALRGALASQQSYNSAKEIFDLIQSGAYTGTAAGTRTALDKMFVTAGLGDPSKVATSEALAQRLAKSALDYIQASGLGSKAFDSNAEKEMLAKAVAGTPDMSPLGLKTIAKYQMRQAKLSRERGYKVLDRMEQNPATADMVRGYRPQLDAYKFESTKPTGDFKSSIQDELRKRGLVR